MKLTDNAQLAEWSSPSSLRPGWLPRCWTQRLPQICALFKDRCETLVDLAAWVRRFYLDTIERNADDYAKHVTAEAAPLLDAFAAALQTVEWSQKPSLRPSSKC